MNEVHGENMPKIMPGHIPGLREIKKKSINEEKVLRKD
jgi:hypothetical protein